MAVTTTGTAMYDVAPTVLPKQGMSPHEVLAQQSQQAQAARAKAQAQASAEEAKRREQALALANATMEKLNAENWMSDNEYFNSERKGLTDSYTEMLKRTNGNPTQEDLNTLNQSIADYQLKSKYSIQNKDEFKSFEGVITDPNKADKYTPESIEQTTQWYNLPFAERLDTKKNPKPELQYIKQIEEWETPFYKWMDALEPLKSYQGATYGGKKFDEKTFREAAINRYQLGVPGEDGKPAIISQQKANDAILKPYQDELADYESPELRAAREQEIIVDWMTEEAKSRNAAGTTSYRAPSGKGKEEEPPYVPSPATPGQINIGKKTMNYKDMYNINIKEGMKGGEVIDVPVKYTPDGESEKGGLVSLSKGAVVYEGQSGKNYVKVKDVKEDVQGGKVVTTHEDRYIEVTPQIDKQLRESSDEYRQRQEYFEGGGATPEGGTSR